MSEAVQRPMGQMPAWLVFSGVAVGVVGASVNKRAEDVGELVVALGSRTDSSDVAIAVALGQLGLVLVVVGAVVVLAGLVVIALAGRHKRRRCAMDPLCCSTPCLTAARSLPSEPSPRQLCQSGVTVRRARPARLPAQSRRPAVISDPMHSGPYAACGPT